MARRAKFDDSPAPLPLGLYKVPQEERLFPEYREGIDHVVSLLRTYNGLLGLDIEFEPGPEITILGIASPGLATACRWEPDILVPEIRRFLMVRGNGFSGYAGIRVDFQILRDIGIKELTLDKVSDGMLRFWLVYAHLCKSPGKEDDDEGGSLGFMNLWTASSLLTDLTQWKVCRGQFCSGPCPRHRKEHYCAIDAWAGLMVDLAAREKAEKIGISEDRYRDRAYIEYFMTSTVERYGVALDPEGANKVERAIEDQKSKIAGLYPNVNFQSPVQVRKALAGYWIYVKNTSKEVIEDCLRKQAPREGITYDEAIGSIQELAEGGGSPDNGSLVQFLAALVAYKESGKGTKSWFSSAVPGEGGKNFVYPRIISVGTSTGRLSSSRPNFQNVASRGWGAAVRSVIVPRRPDLVIVEADYSQLELRMMLYLSGQDVSKIPDDAFTWLVEQSGGLFESAASRLSGLTARQVAKITSHASNYLEGLAFVPQEAGKTRYLVKKGALRLYEDWPAPKGMVAGFNGINLAKRLFGNTGEQARAEALRIQEDVYFKAFGNIREFHAKVLNEVFASLDGRYVVSPVGRALYIYSSRDPAGSAKVLASFYGQGMSADFVLDRIIALSEKILPLIEDGQVFVLPPVHDSVALELPRDWNERQIKDLLSVLWDESRVLPGFRCPMKVKRGLNYGELKEI
jgi:hypothetical protein